MIPNADFKFFIQNVICNDIFSKSSRSGKFVLSPVHNINPLYEAEIVRTGPSCASNPFVRVRVLETLSDSLIQAW